MLDFLILCISILILSWGSVIAVDCAVKLAQFHQLSYLFTGLIILSIGSNLPELVVTISASLNSLSNKDMSGIIIGTSIGSSFTQMGLVLGITGLLTYITASKKEIYMIGTLVILSIFILMLTAFDNVINWVDGLILLSVFCIYFVIVIFGRNRSPANESKKDISTIKNWFLLMFGVVIITISAEVVVNTAANLAINFGMSQSLVAILIIGPGTSLPELAISL